MQEQMFGNTATCGQVFAIPASTAEEAEADVRSRFRSTPQDKVWIVSNEPVANGHRCVMVEWEGMDA